MLQAAKCWLSLEILSQNPVNSIPQCSFRCLPVARIASSRFIPEYIASSTVWSCRLELQTFSRYSLAIFIVFNSDLKFPASQIERCRRLFRLMTLFHGLQSARLWLSLIRHIRIEQRAMVFAVSKTFSFQNSCAWSMWRAMLSDGRAKSGAGSSRHRAW